MKTKRRIVIPVLFAIWVMALAMSVAAHAVTPPVSGPAAHRVGIHLANGAFDVVSFTPVRGELPPPSHTSPNAQNAGDYRFELLAADGSVRYRRIIRGPDLSKLERQALKEQARLAPGNDDTRQSGRFTLLIPHVQSGDQLVLYGTSGKRGENTVPERELFRLTLVPVIG